jgi:hypothetical protein
MFSLYWCTVDSWGVLLLCGICGQVTEVSQLSSLYICQHNSINKSHLDGGDGGNKGLD